MSLITRRSNPSADALSAAGREAPKRVGIRQVAEHAGVAIASVSRVLSDHPDATPRMRERVLAAIEELGYQPDFLAKSLRTGASLMVGIVVSDICNPMMAAIVKAAELRLREAGYTSLVVSSLGDPKLDTQHVAMLSQRRVDGIMIALTDEDHRPTADQLAAARAPVLLLDRDVAGLQRSWAVRFDHAAGLAQGVDHLLDLGHRRIALVNGNPNVRPSRHRVRTLQKTASARGAADSVTVLDGAFTAEHGYRSTLDLMSRSDRPTALISGNNQILIGVLRALRELKITIPDDVSLITCDDVPMADFLSPRLATIRRDVNVMGDTAAKLMLQAMRGGAPRAITLATTFDPAQSCSALVQEAHPVGRAPGTSRRSSRT